MNKTVIFFLAAALSCCVATAQPIAPFRTGERVVFVGNSITEAGYYESYIWLYYMLHFPGRRITVYNAGIGGDRAKNIAARLDDDVFAKKPTTICLTFGMNDTGYFEFLQGNADSTARERIRESHLYFDSIRRRLKGYVPARKILMSSSLYDETVRNPKNYFPGKSRAMQQVAAFQQEAAKQEGWGFVDLLNPMTEITLREQKKDTSFTLTGSDRIHPGNAGHFVMAWLFLKQQGMSGKAVADMVVDVKSAKILRSGNCRLSGLAIGQGEVRFDYLAGSLPFPQDSIPRLWENPHKQTEALDVIPFNDEMNREMLTVKGLSGKSYEVTMDGHRIGAWTGEQLGAGINLALVKTTPEYEQAMSVLWLNERRMELESKLRAYYWLQFDYFRDRGMIYKDDARAMDSVVVKAKTDWAVASKRDNYRAARYPAVRESWQKEMDLIVDEIYREAQPRVHTIVVRPLPGS
ncbi:MAG: SGNH/GDSL hydrolase family protein [Bacteroidetes bacterium]|nr:SGNH/GDSL hydrolase family protein [Bacteroidota bacterium]